MSSFSKNLRQLRREAGMTQDELAQKLNVTRQAVSAWERACTEPDIETLIILTQALGVGVNDLLLGRNANHKKTVQRADLIVVSVSFTVSLIVLVLQLTLYPHLLRLQREHFLPYAVPYNRIVPPIGYFAGGIFLSSLTSLFNDYQNRIGKRLRCLLLFLAVAFSCPSLFVILEEVIYHLFPDYPVPVSSFLFKCCSRNPTLVIILFALFPLLSGILAFSGKGKKQSFPNT